MVARPPPTRLEAMTDSADTRRQLLDLIDELAVVRGKVTLSSGREADYYLDLRRVTLDHRSAPLIGDVVLDLLESEGLLGGIDAVGGLTMGADPVGTAVMHRSVVRGRPLDSFVVRKEAKKHGMSRRVEGPEVKGKRVIAVEDTSTTGGSVLTAVDALRKPAPRWLPWPWSWTVTPAPRNESRRPESPTRPHWRPRISGVTETRLGEGAVRSLACVPGRVRAPSRGRCGPTDDDPGLRWDVGRNRGPPL